MDQTTSYAQAAPQQSYGPPEGFAPPGAPEQFAPQQSYGPPEGFAPPGAPEQFAPYSTGQFAQPVPYAAEPYQPGPYQPVAQVGPTESGSHPVQPNPEQHNYGEYRQEIGADGLVRRVPQDQAAGQADPSGPIYSWAPPPPPMHQPAPPQQQQPMYQQPGPPVGQPPLGQAGPMGQMPPPGWQGEHNPHHPQQPFQPQHMPQPGQPGHSVNDLNLLKRARKAPRSGWRRAMHKATGGMVNPGESAADVVHRDLVDRVNQPVRGDYRIAILSLKGGVGKTTTTVGLGSTFSTLRGDRVIAIDANPDLGTLGHRVPRQTRSTVRNLLEDQHITRYSDVRAHTSQAPSRLEVLASEQDPAVSEAFSEADYRQAIAILQSFYNIILTDCGTGLMHSAMAGVLDMASSLVLVTSPAIDGARSASATLDWLDHHGYGKLVERTVVVVNASRRGASTVDLDQLRKLFLDRTRAVQVVPFDDHLAEGAEIDLELVSKPTRRALLELAAMVADDFGYVGAQQYRPGPHGRH
ncbi:AAA family ATPase [Nocardia sp. GCM10030253]|uniref:nucleotide-binding protein n=1 Tax=Nocardia sp. GCM10030253 TaxID=3273404 RepID=UPI0036443069